MTWLSRAPPAASVRANMGNGNTETRHGANSQDARRAFAPSGDSAARVLVRFDGVSKHFAGVAAVERVSLDIFAGEFFALLGPSGCGKTTLLRLLAGFEVPDEGRILLAGEAPARPSPRRAARRARQEVARGDAVRAHAAAGKARADLHHRDPRPAGGDDGSGPHRRHESRAADPGRHPARGLRAPQLA